MLNFITILRTFSVISLSMQFLIQCIATPSTNYLLFEGEIYWADLGTAMGYEMGKERPVLLVQTNRLTALSPDTVVVAPLSSDLRKREIEELGVPLLRISSRDRLKQDSIVLVDQLRSISPLRFEEPGFLTQLTKDEMEVVHSGIEAILTRKMAQKPQQNFISTQHPIDAESIFLVFSYLIFFLRIVV